MTHPLSISELCFKMVYFVSEIFGYFTNVYYGQKDELKMHLQGTLYSSVRCPGALPLFGNVFHTIKPVSILVYKNTKALSFWRLWFHRTSYVSYCMHMHILPNWLDQAYMVWFPKARLGKMFHTFILFSWLCILITWIKKKQKVCCGWLFYTIKRASVNVQIICFLLFKLFLGQTVFNACQDNKTEKCMKKTKESERQM